MPAYSVARRGIGGLATPAASPRVHLRSSAHESPTADFSCRGPRGDSESGVRTAVALLLREIQHSDEYRNRAQPDGPQLLHGVGPPHARFGEKIMASQRVALASWSGRQAETALRSSRTADSSLSSGGDAHPLALVYASHRCTRGPPGRRQRPLARQRQADGWPWAPLLLCPLSRHRCRTERSECTRTLPIALQCSSTPPQQRATTTKLRRRGVRGVEHSMVIRSNHEPAFIRCTALRTSSSLLALFCALFALV